MPARLARYPEGDVFGVVVALFEFGGDGFVVGGGDGFVVGGGGGEVGGVEVVVARGVAQLFFDLFALRVEGVRDVFEEDEAEDDVFVVGGVQLGA